MNNEEKVRFLIRRGWEMKVCYRIDMAKLEGCEEDEYAYFRNVIDFAEKVSCWVHKDYPDIINESVTDIYDELYSDCDDYDESDDEEDD